MSRTHGIRRARRPPETRRREGIDELGVLSHVRRASGHDVCRRQTLEIIEDRSPGAFVANQRNVSRRPVVT